MAGLYIHIPFCHSKCSYCDFYSMPSVKMSSEYVDALINEWKIRKNEVAGNIETIYLGGGTPSILDTGLLSKLIAALPTENVREFTIEANPEDITRNWIDIVKQLGINRVSIGVQSLLDNELQAVGRRHTAQEAIDAIKLLQNYGITEISADLIYGLPQQTLESWKYSVENLVNLGIPHISSYSLSYEPGTRLYAQLSSGKIEETDEDTVAAMYDMLTSSLMFNGYEHYEISNFAKPWHIAQHNSSYWKFTPYIGLGVSAHSFDGTKRRVNPLNIKKYIEALSSGKTIYEVEDETPTDLYNDYIITSLRTSDGINLDDMRARFGGEYAEEFCKSAETFIASGKLVQPTPLTIRFTEDAWLVSDSVLRELIV